MQIVIDIDENLYTRLFDNGEECVADMYRTCVAIRKGTPLPKGHGDLVDVCEFSKYLIGRDKSFQELLKSLPVAVQSDKKGK